MGPAPATGHRPFHVCRGREHPAMNVFKKIITRYLDNNGRQVRKGTPGATQVREFSRKYYGRDPATGKPVPLAANKVAAELLLAQMVRKAELKEANVFDPYEGHTKRPLAEHLDDFRKDLAARDNSPRYVALVVSRLRALLDGCGFLFLADLSANRVMTWLADLRRKADARAPLPPGKELFTARETAALLGITLASLGEAARRHRLELVPEKRRRLYPRAAVEFLQDCQAQGRSVQTTNYYLSHLKSFCRWLVKDRRMGDNPVAHLDTGKVEADRRHDRRELEVDELRRLLVAARSSDRVSFGLSGGDRFVLYATACGTGFRASALASLTPESFDLDADAPTVTLAARSNKSKKTKVQPVPADVAALLRDYLAG